jgi:hypothetical protein
MIENTIKSPYSLSRDIFSVKNKITKKYKNRVRTKKLLEKKVENGFRGF